LLGPGNVDFENRILHLDDTKSLKPRSIPLTDRAYNIIKRRFTEHGGQMFESRNPRVIGYKFSIERRYMYKWEEVPPWRFHDLRHTWATNLLKRGVDPYTVMELGGWSKLDMVTRYLHSSDERKKKAIETLDNKIDAVKKWPKK